MKGKSFKSLMCGMSLLATGCTAALERTNRIATDYNRVYAKARNEQILLNVLRAWRREPLQFSVLGAVSSTVRSSASIEIPFSNILLGTGDESISPTLALGGGPSPTVGIAPLNSQEFTRGILRPVSADILESMLAQGVRREVVLPLLVGGVVCSGNRSRINAGSDVVRNWRFFGAAQRAESFSIGRGPSTPFASLRMPAEEAATFLQTGPGEGREVRAVVPVSHYGGVKPAAGIPPSPDVVVEVNEQGKRGVSGLPLNLVCSDLPFEKPSAPAARQGSADVPISAEPSLLDPATDGMASAESLVMRSVGSMFRYLAAVHDRTVQADLARCVGLEGMSQSSDTLADGRRAELARQELQARQEFLASVIAEYRRRESHLRTRSTTAANGSGGATPNPGLAASLARQADEAAGRREQVEAAERGEIAPEWLRMGSRPDDLFRVRIACRGEVVPPTAFTSVAFEGHNFYIQSATYADGGDLTLETLALLSDLLALQTSEAALQSTTPLIALRQ